MSEGGSREAKAAHIRQLLETEGDAVARNTRGFNAGRYDSVSRLDDYEELKAEARAIKEDAIERLPELVEQLRETVEENGGTLYIADDAADANRYVGEVCDETGAERVVKSKSMTSEEIDVNEALEADGVDVVETDLGEWVLQVAEEAPSHIVAPALHKSREGIADLFNATFEPEEPLETAEELTMFAREHLGKLIEDAEVGMTGANFVTADTGTIALVTSEGNARKSVAATDTHVAVAGVEKVIPTVEDLQPFVELIGRSGTGQDITSYVSLLTPPMDSPTLDFDDPETPLSETEADREFHLVLIDNGRMEMREDEHLKETLYCIRCSACSNSCANFQSVGGHAFGGETYSGGIATGWEAGIEGLDTASEFNDLCTGCSRCVNACPVGIDIPWINTVVRDRINREKSQELDWLVEGLTPDEESGGVDIQKRFFGNFRTAAKVGSALAPVSNWAASLDISRTVMEKTLGVARERDLPEFQRETLKKWFEKRGGAAASKRRATEARAERGRKAERDSTAEGPARRAVLYPDLYTNHVQVERGKAAVAALEALGVEVVVPDVAPSGRAPLSQGMIATAEKQAHEVSDGLGEYVDGGFDVVVVEPSDLAMFDREYEKLLPAESQRRLSEHSYEVMEYIFGLLENGSDADTLSAPDAGDERVAYHSHCQQRTLGLEGYTESVLERLGYDVLTSDTECCGMAGSFGYKSEYYELSMDVGDELKRQFETAEARDRTVVASGTSCLDQLDSLLRRSSKHPVEMVAPDRP